MKKALPIVALALSVSMGPAAEELPKGLVLHMNFDQVQKQEVPNVQGVVPGGTGKEAQFVPVEGAGGALSIRQDDEKLHYVEIADHAEFNKDAFTVAAWVCPRRIDVSGTIVCKHDWLNGGGRGFVLRTTAKGIVNFTIGAGGWISTNSTSVVRSQEWVHAAAVFDGKKLSIYFDGRLEATTEISKPYEKSPYPVRIGHGAYSLDRHRKFDGMIDNAMIWNRALKADELAAVVEATQAVRPPPPTAEEIASIVQGLSALKYRDREEAQEELFELGSVVLPELKKHRESRDPELRKRVRSLLRALSEE